MALETATSPRLEPCAPTTELRGVGPGVAARLAAAGIATVGDLLRFFPRRAEEVEPLEGPDEAWLGRMVRLEGEVVDVARTWLPGRRSLVRVSFVAPDGGAFRVGFFNQPYLLKAYSAGVTRILEGRLNRQGKHFVLEAPRVLTRGHRPDGAVVVRYPAVDGVSDPRLRAFVQQAMERVDWDVPLVAALPAELEAELRAERGEVDGGECALRTGEAAVRAMHTPRDVAEHEAARRRFALVEAVALFRKVEARRQARRARRGPAVVVGPEHAARMAGIVPFAWTGDQAVAVEQIRRALAGPEPCGALLHGDVGTGKTAVAVDAAVAMVDAGYQVALLAPTELLAEQHFSGIRTWLAEAGVRVELLVGSLALAERRRLEAALAAGEIDFVIGTHALFSASTRFRRLGLAIVDEQHRFGVEQRTAFAAKGEAPHVLVMTATPIPRTLTLTLFGDLDTFTLEERPPGRRMPPALFVERSDWPRVLRAIARHVRRAGRVYVVCHKIGADGQKGGAVRLAKDLGARFRTGLVHGRMPAAERQERTDAFRAGECDVLVGTTVLEVGVDVPDATLMVVVGADRFGIATLHQLRGRVGRSHRRGLCILTGEDTERTRAVCKTTDGFALAEQDLRLRGAGELLGAHQSGALDFRALDPLEDLPLLALARQATRTSNSG